MSNSLLSKIHSLANPEGAKISMRFLKNRIIIIASFYQIKQGNARLTLSIAEKMLTHRHDLIHKALGWMPRGVGKRCSIDELRGFLNQHATRMPRTMLRYAIEKMETKERGDYLAR